MKYDHILIRYGELSLKGNNINFFIKTLHNTIKEKLTAFPNIQIKRTQGRLFILLNDHEPEPIINKCKDIFGIHSLSLAIKVDNKVEAIEKACMHALTESQGNTFKVSVRRVNKTFPHGSQEMNHILGSYLLRSISGYSVDVHHPDVEIKVEIHEQETYITSKTILCRGGLPVGTGGRTLLLLSGGIDSPVAGFQAMKRGVSVDAIHFHSPPFTSERAKQKVIDLAQQLTYYGETINLLIVPFTELQQEIFKKIPDAYTMTVMRRIMMRISEAICQKHDILSITTGESLGQVASQTMESMHAINEVTNYPVLRPLVTMDKEEIIRIARDIGTYDISIQPYEDCCTVFMPKKPKTRPKRDKVSAIESEFDFNTLIQETIEAIEIVTITADVTSQDEFVDLL